MNQSSEPNDEVYELFDAAIEDRMTDEQRRRLEEMVKADSVVRQMYVEFVHQHSSLQWWMGVKPAVGSDSLAEQDSGLFESPIAPIALADSSLNNSRTRSTAVYWASCAAMLACGVAIGMRTHSATNDSPIDHLPATVATLSETKGCIWTGATLPTQAGAALTPGRLNLAAGLAKFAFAKGAEVTLEGPADLEIHSSMRCVLHSGKLVAKVPPAAIGFTVDTPTAIVVDQGTEFGLNVLSSGTAEVQVFDGIVDVEHKMTHRKERIETGANVKLTTKELTSFDPDALPGNEEPMSPLPHPKGARVLQLSTAELRGKDAYIQSVFPKQHASETLLQIKNCLEDGHQWLRKAYMGFDLSPLQGMNVADAHLVLAVEPTGLGFSTDMPDSTFAIYGLKDEKLDQAWDETNIEWNSAPANLPGGAAVDLSKVELLGKFVVPQGMTTGSVRMKDAKLGEFLNRDTNQIATLILVRETVGIDRGRVVHGFASRRHPTAPPPTLRLVVVPK